MVISDWITLAAVLVALGLGISSLMQTQRLQKRERKERLLNEIIEWGIDVGKSGSNIDFLLRAAEIDEQPWSKETNLPNLHSNLRELSQRGEYIIKVAGTLDKSLLAAVQVANGRVTKYLESIDILFINIRLGIEGNLPIILKPLMELDSLVPCAKDLLAEATKIKARDIC